MFFLVFIAFSTNQNQGECNQFNKPLRSLTDPTSPWVVVNKQHPLNPQNYIPADLVVPAVSLRLDKASEQMRVSSQLQQPIKAMFGAAQARGYQLSLGSGYRSYNHQQTLYSSYVTTQGQAAADRQSARAGYSEHQLGLAFDIEITGMKCHLRKCLGDTPDGRWIADNAYLFGFVIRYPKDKTLFTGYDYEPWHVRYIGKELATEMHAKKIKTLEECFNISGGASY